MKSYIETFKRLGTLLTPILFLHVSYGQEKPTFDIGILVDSVRPGDTPLLDMLQAEIRAVVGEDATINFPSDSILSNEFNVSAAESHYETLLLNDTDIIIAFGPVNNEVISRQSGYPKPTILFGAVNLDLVDLGEEAEISGIDNFNYLIASHSYRKDLQTFKTLFDFQHVGVLVEEPLSEILPIQNVLEDIFRDLNARFTLVPFGISTDLAPYLSQIDALYLAEGFSLTPVQIEELARALFELGIPSFTSTSKQDVERGLMATNQADESVTQFFRRIALNVESVVNGVNLSDLPIQMDLVQRLTINVNTADKVRVPIKFGMITTTDLVGDFKNVISERTYSLLDVIDEALERNLGLNASEKQIDLADQDVRVARSSYRPDLSVSTTGTYVDSETARLSNGQNPEYSAAGSVTVTQTIFSEPANANIESQTHRANAEREIFNAAALDVILDATNAYFNTLILKTNVQIRYENLEVTRENLRVAEQNFEAGQAGRSDVLRFRSEMAQNMQALVESAHQLEQGFFALNELLNHPIDREIDVKDAAIDDDVFKKYKYDEFQDLLDDPSLRKAFVRFLVDEAKNNAPELRALDYNREAIRRNILLNGRRRYLPTIAAQAQYNRNFDQWGAGTPPPESTLRDNFSAAISLSIPLFPQNQRNIDRQIAIIQREQLVLDQQNTALGIERNVRVAVLDVVNEISNIELSRVAEEAAEGGLELVRTAYSSGAATLVEVLDAQNNYLQAQFARANAGYNYLLTSVILERFIGYYFLLHSELENEAFSNRFLEYLENLRE